MKWYNNWGQVSVTSCFVNRISDSAHAMEGQAEKRAQIGVFGFVDASLHGQDARM